MIIMINPKRSFKIKKANDEILNRIIKPDKPPIEDPRNNLILEVCLFKTIEIPSNSIKSNKKLIKKT